MNRLITRSLGLATFLIGSFFVGAAAAEEPLTTPSLDTKGKPLNPPAPTVGATPKLGGLSAFGGVMIVDMGPVNDRLQEQRALYPSDVPVVFPLLGGQGFGLFSHFLIGGSGAGLLSRSVDAANDRNDSASDFARRIRDAREHCTQRFGRLRRGAGQPRAQSEPQ